MLILLLACAPADPSDTAGVEFACADDAPPPTLSHEPPEDPPPLGVPLRLTVAVEDACRTAYVYLLFRPADADGDWSMAPMGPDGDLYAATLRAEEQSEAGVLYYFEAINFREDVATEPAGGADDPFLVTFR
jgi:hypothetical protein